MKPLISPAQLPSALIQGQHLRIYRQMSSTLRKALPYRAFVITAARFFSGAKQYKLLSTHPLWGNYRYVWVDHTGKKGLAAVFTKHQVITSILFTPLARYPDKDRIYTKTPFIFSFHGRWFTFWGGTNELVNYHYAHHYKRYAYDFLIMKGEHTYSGDPKKNESYFAFGQEILAPASGKVVRVVNDIPDNEPVGKMDATQRAGNYVAIDHGNGEISLLAHLKMNSVRVQAGDVVQQGDLIGLCGNSGNSSEPHLHFQVSTSSEYPNTSSIRIRFQSGIEPIQSQFVTGP